MKLLALDIGGVCLSLFPQRTYDFFGIKDATELKPEWLKIMADYSCGRCSSQDFSNFLQSATDYRFSPEQVKFGWNLWIGQEIPQTTRMLENFWKNGWEIVFFSDTQPWHLEEVIKRLPYIHRLHGAVYSFQTGAEKTSPAMFQAFEERFGKPDLFLDDRLCNINCALDCGWNAVLF